MRSYRWIIIAFTVVASIYWTKTLLIDGQDEVSIYDLPKQLEEERSSCIVYPVDGTSMEIYALTKTAAEEDRLYLIAKDIDVTIPPRYHVLKDSGYVLQVFGQYYYGKGIPAQYIYVQPKPPRLRVFLYDSVALIRQ